MLGLGPMITLVLTDNTYIVGALTITQDYCYQNLITLIQALTRQQGVFSTNLPHSDKISPLYTVRWVASH